MNAHTLSQTIYRLDAWFQTMRDERGYGGPITHWWQSCLLYCGSMSDWRYEGVMCGYLNLYRATGQSRWLDRAIAAGEDLLRAQLPAGHFWNSGFEVGPLEGGTPHEAAVDVALLELARLLRSRGDERYEVFYRAAERNIVGYHLQQLWDGTAFRDQAWNSTLVPNKNATTLEALVLYEELSGRSMQRYTDAVVKLIRENQVTRPGPRQGATIHLGTGLHRLAIGVYTARCATALIRLYEHRPKAEYVDSACGMIGFLLRLIIEEGTLFGIYPDGRPIACPIWVSPSGDLLRALLALCPYLDVPPAAICQLANLLIDRQLPSGGIPTAYGLGFKGHTRRPSGRPDFRDVLPVAGWCDKAFRALTMLVTELDVEPPQNGLHETAVECEWKGRACLFREDEEHLQLLGQHDKQIIYEWIKGERYPRIYQL